jgi:hypothetical protein
MNKFNKIALIASLVAIFCVSNVLGQERPMRIGVKLGVPQLAGFNLEYVTPLLNKRLAADADITYIPISAGDATVTFLNLGIYANYYFFNEGRGLYGGLGFDRLSLSAEQSVSVTAGTEVISATGKGDLGINMFAFKLGGKHGGLFYFRWELGYALGIGSSDLEVSATATSSTGVTASQNEKVDVPYTGGPIANIGFGFAF